MKTQTHRTIATAGWMALFVIACAMPSGAQGAPPAKREPRVVRGLEKVGGFFFKIARKLEQNAFPEELPQPQFYEERRMPPHRIPPETETTRPSTGLVLPPGYRTYPMPEAPSIRHATGLQPRTAHPMARSETFTPPNFQPNPQPRLHRPSQAPRDVRSSLSLPAPSTPPETAPHEKAGTPPARGAPFDPPATPSSRGSAPGSAEERKPAVLPPVPDQPPFATPVPGRKGFVYPPGAAHDLKNMVDVRDFDTGQKVRDPRTGNVFLVPPR